MPMANLDVAICPSCCDGSYHNVNLEAYTRVLVQVITGGEL